MKKYNFVYVELGDTWGQREHNDGGFVLNWGVENIGFGQLSFVKLDGKLVCYTECMSKEFIDQAVQFWLESMEYVDE